MMSGSNAVSFRVGFKCIGCSLVFKSAETYCSHKVEFHFAQLTKSRFILFEESSAPTKQIQNVERVLAPNEMQEIIVNVNKLKNKTHVEVIKQEPLSPIPISESVNSATNSTPCQKNPFSLLALTYADGGVPKSDSESKTEWVEDTVIKNGSDPLQMFYVARSRSIFTTKADHESVVNAAANGSDSDDNIICLDDPLPHTRSKIVSSKIRPTATESTSLNVLATAKLSRLILSQLKLRCRICSRKFATSAQLKIHVTFCQLNNEKKSKESAGASKTPDPDVRSRGRCLRAVKTGARNGSSSFVSSEKSGRGIRRSRLKSHSRTERKLLARNSDRKWVCQTCGFAFRSNRHLKGHAMVHSSERPFKCSVPKCDHAFKYGRSLKKHVKSVHPKWNRTLK